MSEATSDPTVAIGDTITTDGTTITDGSNGSPTNAFSSIGGTFTDDVTPPTIASRETVDLNGNGFIDALHITFDEPILDTSVTATDFDVAGVTGEAFSSTTAGDTADDDDIYITFADDVLDSGATPTLTYAAGTLTDLASNAMVSDGPYALVAM